MSCVRTTRCRMLIGLAISTWPILSAAAAFANAPAAAARPGVRALEQASDAFGVRVGVEQIGLYSESQVRGLSLQDAGNYRLSGAYFVRAGNLVDVVLGGVTTRVGLNALDADFPAPSGLVDYRLKSPLEFRGVTAELSAREYGGTFVESIGAVPFDDRAALLVGGQANLGKSSAGYDNVSFRLGVVGEWRPSEATRLLAFGTVNDFDLEGSYGVTATDAVLPPRMPHPNRYVPRWGDHDGQDINGGLIVASRLRPELTMHASGIYSRLELDTSDFVNLALDRDGTGHASIVSNRPRKAEAVAGAIGAAWSHAPGRRLFGEVRVRSTRNALAPGVSIRIPGVDQALGLPDTEQPSLPPLDPTIDRTEQITAGVGYEAAFGGFRLKGGVQRAHYRRRYDPPGLPETASEKAPWLYDLSLVAALGGDWTAFATLARGLEDTGVAPNNAINRNEVLPAVVAGQQEIGVRKRLGADLTLIASAYSIEKPAAVFDAAGVYGLSGDLRHRGLELSLAGRVAPGLRTVTGAALLDAKRSGERVDLGLVSAEPPGASRWQALGGLSWSVPAVDGLSLDTQVNHFSSRRVRSDRDMRTPAYTTVDLGALHNFTVGKTAMTLRLRIINLFDSDAWVAQRSELLDRVGRRGVRLTLSVRGRS